MDKQEKLLNQLRGLVAGRHRLSGEFKNNWIEDVSRLIKMIDEKALEGVLPRSWKRDTPTR